MKKLIFLSVLVCFSIFTMSAQKSYNLNALQTKEHKEIAITKSEFSSDFKNAKRVRELQINPALQKQNQVSSKDTITLDLFNDKLFKASVENVSVDVNGTLFIRAKFYAYCMISSYKGNVLLQ